MKKTIIYPLLTILGIFIFGVGVGILLNQSYSHKQKELLPPHTPKIDRCLNNVGLYTQKGLINKTKLNLDELWQMASENNGIQTVINKKQQKGVILSWLIKNIGKGSKVEIQPCTGDPVFYDISKINQEPQRLILLRRPHNQLKLIDTSISNQKPVIRGIHLIRVLDK
jgi:hypothetical protein